MIGLDGSEHLEFVVSGVIVCWGRQVRVEGISDMNATGCSALPLHNDESPSLKLHSLVNKLGAEKLLSRKF